MTFVLRRLWRELAIAGVAAGLLAIAVAAAPAIAGQRADSLERGGNPRPVISDGWRGPAILAGRGAELGISVRDLGSAEREEGDTRAKQGASARGGVVVEDVRPNSPAEKAGLKRADLIVEFDGERVRSARQFARLVQETPPGRTVTATVVRSGETKQLQVAPAEGGTTSREDGWLWDRFENLSRLHDLPYAQPRIPGPVQPPFDFNFDFGSRGHGRLGITIQELTPQLATYFGVREGGVLVSSVADESPAARAGLKAGDVITNVNGQIVRSGDDLIRRLEGIKDEETVTIRIVRDRSETTVTATLEARSGMRRGRAV